MCMIITDSTDNFSSRLKKVSVKKEELVNRDLYPEEVTQILDELKKSNYFVYTAFFLLTTTGLRIEKSQLQNGQIWSIIHL